MRRFRCERNGLRVLRKRPITRCVKSFVVAREMCLKANVDPSIRFAKTRVCTLVRMWSDDPKRPWIFILFSYQPEKKD